MTKRNENATFDAALFRRTRTISAAHGSSVRKLIRANRIEAGLRPLKMKRKWTFRAEAFGSVFTSILTLHPNKGFRHSSTVTAA